MPGLCLSSATLLAPVRLIGPKSLEHREPPSRLRSQLRCQSALLAVSDGGLHAFATHTSLVPNTSLRSTDAYLHTSQGGYGWVLEGLPTPILLAGLEVLPFSILVPQQELFSPQKIPT